MIIIIRSLEARVIAPIVKSINIVVMCLLRWILSFKRNITPLPAGKLGSRPCNQAQLQSPTFQDWVVRMREEPMRFHRKIWEYCFIAQALHERGMLRTGSRGMGFGVGQEPLTALFASMGCEVVASDLATEEAHKDNWVESAQHADSLEALNNRGICDPKIFAERVSFRFVDMRNLPDDLGTFDFVWSSCSLEHLGSIALGEEFIYKSLEYLKPGGVSVHTTEYNVLSNIFSITRGPTVVFRRRDLRRITDTLRQRGYRVDLHFTNGDLPHDFYVDLPPYKQEVHLKLLLGKYIVTSFALIIEN